MYECVIVLSLISKLSHRHRIVEAESYCFNCRITVIFLPPSLQLCNQNQLDNFLCLRGLATFCLVVLNVLI
jgi:hypothetical protein